MNLLMLGNGFDLYYKLPTKYINFLNVASYMATHRMTDVKTVGDIFSSNELTSQDKTIAESYGAYKETYDKVELPKEIVEQLVGISKSNMWFKYLYKSFNKDVGWIDFEQEIATVVKYMCELLSDKSPKFSLNMRVKSRVGQFIVKEFAFFFQRSVNSTSNAYHIIPEYTFEYPHGSGNMQVDKAKIIKILVDNLSEFADALRVYLQFFIDRVVVELRSEGKLDICDVFANTDYVVTLNYTKTYEKFFSQASTIHLHGKVDDKIVLGINPDETDEIETIDTSFAAFKKYFQRVFYRTDIPYLQAIKNIKELVEHKSLIVMGHSLDVTDKDVIAQMFELSDDIVVLYHSDRKHSEFISNLINIFGMTKFLELRSQKNLRFVSLDDNLDELARQRQRTSRKAIVDSFLGNVLATPTII